MTKKSFDTPLTEQDFHQAAIILQQADAAGVRRIVNVGTSLIESVNCILLAERFPTLWAAIGIHPNDLTTSWKTDLEQLEKLLTQHRHSIVAIGECGIDKHYPEYDLERQKEAFRAQITLALRHNLAVIVHSRSAPEETLAVLHEFEGSSLRGIIHCFSENLAFAQDAIKLGFKIGIGGTLTYPKNEVVREVVKALGIEQVVLETDAPFLPIQSMRGKQNHPMFILEIASYIAQLLNLPLDVVSQITTQNALKILKLTIE